MSEAITGVSKFAFALISKKVRSYGAEKLQDGGLVDQKFRGLIVRELDEIKFKLDANARKDLSTSISSLGKGYDRLFLSLDKCFENANVSLQVNAAASFNPTKIHVSLDDALALAKAVGAVKTEANELFEKAKESFKDAELKANEAFNNAALSTEERVVACKVRIASAILENLDNPEVAASDSLRYLQELHTMSAIQEIFSVHIEGGIKAFFKKKSRAEIVETITVINMNVAEFIAKFTKRRMGVFDWPSIDCRTRVVHPIHHDRNIVQEMQRVGKKLPWARKIATPATGKRNCAVNSKGEILVSERGFHCLQKFNGATGNLQAFSQKTWDVHSQLIFCIDEDDAVYAVSYCGYSKGCGAEHVPSLIVYKPDGEVTQNNHLHFIKRNEPCLTAATKDKVIVIYCKGYKNRGIVYSCDGSGKLLKSFPFDMQSEHNSVLSMFVSCDESTNDNEIIFAIEQFVPIAQFLFQSFTLDGQLKKKMAITQEKLPPFCDISLNHVTKDWLYISSLAFNHMVSVTCISSKTGELRNCIYLDLKMISYENAIQCYHSDRIITHPKGAVAFVCRDQAHVLYLQSPLVVIRGDVLWQH